MTQNYLPSKKDFWFLPLGGSGEIGMNMNLYGHDGAWLIVDLGVMFNDRLGIDVLTPNPEFIAERQDRLAGLVLTHAHEDHVGAVPYLWLALQCPIYATKFTAAVLRNKLSEVSWGHRVPVIEIPLSGEVKIGPFNIEFVTLTHSIPEPNALLLSTPLGRVLHTGDWKLDDAPQIGETTNQKRLQQIGDEGVLALVCDSTNVFTPGVSGSEQTVKDNMLTLMGQYPNRRLVLSCFASNIARVKTIVEAGLHLNRKVCLLGRSLVSMVRAAQESGYLKDLPPFLEPKEAMALPRDEVLFLSTGSQGEPRSALARIANKTHPSIRLDAGDVVIFSSRIIPGNEKSIGLMQNRLVEQGLHIVTSYDEDIHVSGHPAQDELLQMYAWTRPDVLVPVHGEYRHMTAQAHLGLKAGIPDVIVPVNGDLIQLAGKKKGKFDQVMAGRLGLDGNRMVPLESDNLKERTKLSIHGAIVASVILDKAGVIMRPPHFTYWGLPQDEDEQEDFERRLNRALRAILSQGLAQKNLLESLRLALRKVATELYDKKPLVDIHLMQV